MKTKKSKAKMLKVDPTIHGRIKVVVALGGLKIKDFTDMALLKAVKKEEKKLGFNEVLRPRGIC